MTCAACGCNSRYFKESGKQFFSFPVKDRERFSKWVAAFQHQNWKPSDTLCSDHFTEDDFVLLPGALFPRLREDAVPSVFHALQRGGKKSVHSRKNSKKRKRKLPEKISKDIDSDDENGHSESYNPEDHIDHTYSVACSELEDIPFSSLSPSVIKLKKKIRRLTRRAQRQKHKIQTMKLLVKQLKQNNMVKK
ncbi:THAP domain-containing protein 1-like [Spea bombifrons]|uniref:THAP domain-containing protein 1-like n=1 Tax=Spea bombifrons TaxID=233779 RepID=UPI002349808A|nr:THAP domain-containing protein 1-like [Spea bombifrons]XP_053309110.1 THAP domain-containing protein 1-like [Spea bombifrons]XP_053309112.1 THAP domain-containing protein 1-like [Spea bombifrons]XP_053309113.1 THAP domain-containing protein 1-like [Spea bombifrons]